MTLRTVLGEWLAGWRVASMKIDAQGSDLAILSAAPRALLRRVEQISLEVLRDSCDGVYAGQPTCAQVVRTMRDLGFANSSACERSAEFAGCEANFVFEHLPRGARGYGGGSSSRRSSSRRR